MKIEKFCPSCRKTFVIEVPQDGYERWLSGELPQNAMPDVPSATREQLITGIDDACWRKMWIEVEDV